MVKEQSLSVLIAEADKVFSEYVRLKDAEHFTGLVKCFITGQVRHWTKMDAAHYVSRKHLGTRWNEMNVHPCIPDSNRFDTEHYDDYDEAMASTYTTEQLESLHTRGTSLLKPTRNEVWEFINDIKQKVKELRKQKHL